VNEEERFAEVLSETAALLRALWAVGLTDVILIGAQVVALEQRARNLPLFELTTGNGTRINRGFSFEPDLVIDCEEPNRLEELPVTLRQCGFERTQRPGRPSTWSKKMSDFTMDVDLFTTADLEAADLPTPMTRLRGAPRIRTVEMTLEDGAPIKIPDSYTFLSLKLDAKLRIRPGKTKDSLDMYAFVHVVGPEKVNESLVAIGIDGERVRRELRGLFERPDSPGVKDILNATTIGMEEFERQLIARAVVDTFETIIGGATEFTR
jgi:hypothetical protein